MMGNPDATAAHIAELHAAWRARWWERAEKITATVADVAARATTTAALHAARWRGYEAHNRDEMVRVMGGSPRPLR